jgi:signal transduction histidine kinase/CheY-like chemotaxis protein/class 3 adenylate cyclase
MSTLQSRQSPKGPKPKLLVVDDEPDNLDLLYRTFYREFQVIRAEDGLVALERLAAHPDVAVIISDQRMPGMSGTEFLRRTAADYPDIMRIILTGYTDVEDLVGAINEGKVFKYVTKPWDDVELKEIVRQALEAHRLLKARTTELNRALRQETLLNAITNTIRSAQTLHEMLQTIVDTVGRTMDVSYCVLQPFYEASPQSAYFTYCNPSHLTHDSNSGETPCNQADLEATLWQTQEIVLLDQPPNSSRAIAAQPERRAAFERLGIQSSLLIPLQCKQDLVAVLALHQCQPDRSWESSEVQLLVTLADQAALAVAQVQTYERVEALARREVLINTITTAIRSSLNPQKTFAAITHTLGQALQVDGCALSLWTEAEEFVQCVGLYNAEDSEAEKALDDPAISDIPQSQVPISGNPVLQQLLATQKPVVLSNLDQQPELVHHDLPLRAPAKALLVVPLIVDGQIIGSISLRQFYQPRQWHSDEVDLAQVVAAQAAIAVQQARLYQTTRQQAEQLLALDRQKTEFFQNISHEFRTPLTLMIGPLEGAVAQGEGLGYDQATIALRNSRRLLRLVNQLLDIQRLDAGRMQPTFRPCDPVAFIHEIIEAFKPYCDRKSLHLVADLQPSPSLYLDLEKFDKVLYNLLSNAIKFTPAEGTIAVRLIANADTCEIEVEDTGIGIRADQLPTLFERFRQADGSSNRNYEGSGLGLALVQALVKLHGGDITVTSQYGQGTKFTITLPLGKRHLAPSQIVEQPVSLERQRAAVELADVELPYVGDEKPADAPLIYKGGLSETLPQILVVDDNPDLRAYVSHVLQHVGYQIRTAHNGAVAYEIAQTFRPDLILTDWMMPEVTGLELIQLIRAHPDLSSTPIVLLTAKVDDETRIEGVEQGADAYLGKPFNDRELLAEVRNLLALKANERRVAELNQYLTESVLRRFLPQSLVQKAALGQLQLDLQPEPRLITILFSDIVGFTQLSNSLGPQRIAELLNEYLDAMTQAIFEYGGTVDKFMGDGVLALFGAPEDLSPSEQAHRAIAATRRMHQHLRLLNQRWQVQGIPPLQFRCGIHQGNAVVGMFGSAERTDFTAIGPSVNMAARLQEAAMPNGILVSEEVGQYLSADAILEAQPLILKGISEPVMTLSVRVEVDDRLPSTAS